MRSIARLVFSAAAFAGAAFAQDNYEVQVYGSDLVPQGVTMVELHSNFTARGVKQTIDGVLPTHHAAHQTLEVTHGFDEWFELGMYQFTSIQADGSWMWVGAHLRPRVAVPKRYGLPVGLSLSTEFGYQRPAFSLDTWGIEIRPIVDKTLGKWYLSFNPTVERSLRGPGSDRGFELSPNFKFAYDLTPRVAAGVEYYGGFGPLSGFDPLREQYQQFIPAIDVDFGPQWEFNFGVGWGVTQATDRLLIKGILGYRFNFRNQ